MSQFCLVYFLSDQASTKRGFECVQGLVNLYNVNPGDASLHVLKDSHLLHGEYFDKFGITCKKDWYKVPSQEHYNFFTSRGCKEATVLAKAGDLVLWDSRTMHQGIEPRKGRANPSMRSVVYVCMTERRRADDKKQKRRREIFAQERTTPHIPHVPRVFGLKPQTYGNPMAPSTANLRIS